MGKNIRDNLKFYIVCAAFGISLVGNFTGFGKDLNQIDTNKVEIVELKKDNKIEHKEILNEIKGLQIAMASSNTKDEVLRSQNRRLIQLLEKKYGK